MNQKESLILSALGTSDEMTAMQIAEVIKQETNGAVKYSYDSLYSPLYRLEQQGLVDSRMGTEKPEERGGARRRYYRRTEDGLRALNAIQSDTSGLSWNFA